MVIAAKLETVSAISTTAARTANFKTDLRESFTEASLGIHQLTLHSALA
jgi:hypothetical protein